MALVPLPKTLYFFQMPNTHRITAPSINIPVNYNGTTVEMSVPVLEAGKIVDDKFEGAKKVAGLKAAEDTAAQAEAALEKSKADLKAVKNENKELVREVNKLEKALGASATKEAKSKK